MDYFFESYARDRSAGINDLLKLVLAKFGHPYFDGEHEDTTR